MESTIFFEWSPHIFQLHEARAETGRAGQRKQSAGGKILLPTGCVIVTVTTTLNQTPREAVCKGGLGDASSVQVEPEI